MRFIALFAAMGIFLWAGLSYAQDDPNLIKRRIRALAFDISDETRSSVADMVALRQAENNLISALRLLRRGGNGGPADPVVFRQCVQYAQTKYRRQYNASDALVRAESRCMQVVDFDVLQFLWEKHYRDNDSSQAMDLANWQADFGVKGKLDLIEWAHGKHFRDNNSSTAATLAVENVQKVGLRSGIACFEQNFRIHYRGGISSSEAMNRTARSCSIQP